jgi:hypothetical protein
MELTWWSSVAQIKKGRYMDWSGITYRVCMYIPRRQLSAVMGRLHVRVRFRVWIGVRFGAHLNASKIGMWFFFQHQLEWSVYTFRGGGKLSANRTQNRIQNRTCILPLTASQSRQEHTSFTSLTHSHCRAARQWQSTIGHASKMASFIFSLLPDATSFSPSH